MDYTLWFYSEEQGKFVTNWQLNGRRLPLESLKLYARSIVAAGETPAAFIRCERTRQVVFFHPQDRIGLLRTAGWVPEIS